MTEEEKKKNNTRKTSWTHHGCKLAALMKKRTEEILRNKEQSSVQSTEQSSVQPAEQPSVQSTVQSNDTYIYGVGTVAVLAIGAFVFFAYNTFQSKKQANEKQNQPSKRRHTL